MKLSDILKTVASGAISLMVPGGPAIVAGINSFLPDDKQLPETATGEQAQSAISALTPDMQASVLNKQYDVEIAEIQGFTDRFKAMAEVDATGNTTRPQIAMMMACVVVFAIAAIVSLFCYAVYKSDNEMIKSIVDGWPFLVAILGIPSALLRAYFAMRTKEKHHKYEMGSGVKQPLNIISSMIGMVKK